MAKDKIAYVCSNCGQESTKWIGKCPACGQWNTFKEFRVANDTKEKAATTAAASAGHALRKNKVLKLRDISNQDDPRIDMHDEELNRVLGGGLVPAQYSPVPANVVQPTSLTPKRVAPPWKSASLRTTSPPSRKK